MPKKKNPEDRHKSTSKAIRFTDDQLHILNAAREEYGTYAKAIEAGLRMLAVGSGDNSSKSAQINEALALELEKLAAELRERSE